MMKWVKAAVCVLFIALCIWGFASWREVMNHQMDKGYEYSKYNIFSMMTER